MPFDKRAAALLIVWVLAVPGVAATPGLALGESLLAAAPQDPAAGEVSLELQWPTRRLIQQGLHNEGFDPGTADGLFGPRTRAAIQEGQQSRGGAPTGYLNDAEAELLRTPAAPPPAAPEAPPPPGAVPAVAPTASSAAAAPASTPTETDPSPASPATVAAAEVDPQNAARTNTQQPTPAGRGDATVQLPPEILVDRHLVRAERLLAAGDPAAPEAMNEVLALQEDHDLELQDGFDFEYAQVAYATARTETAIASPIQYLASAGRQGEFYREALELLDSAEARLERVATERRRAEAPRRRAEADRRRAARWPPGHVFRHCETCPEMVVLPGSAVETGRYEATVAEYPAFASATGARGEDRRYYNHSSHRTRATDNPYAYSWRDPGFPQTDRHPVTYVSWDDAQTYLSWLRATTDARYRLRTWEEFDGAAVSQPGCHSRNPDRKHFDVATRGCHEPVSGGARTRYSTRPVGTYGRNPLRMSDMLGNVNEWTPLCQGGDSGRRLAHDGSWTDHQGHQLHGGFRAPTDYRCAHIGFRVTKDAGVVGCRS